MRNLHDPSFEGLLEAQYINQCVRPAGDAHPDGLDLAAPDAVDVLLRRHLAVAVPPLEHGAVQLVRQLDTLQLHHLVTEQQVRDVPVPR